MVQINSIASDRVELAKQTRSLTDAKFDRNEVGNDKKSNALFEAKAHPEPKIDRSEESRERQAERKQRDAEDYAVKQKERQNEGSRRGSRLDIEA